MGSYLLCRCNNCRVVYINPIPSNKIIRKSNKDEYETIKVERAYIKMRHTFFNRARIYIKRLKSFRTRGRLLDIGCGYGYYFSIFKQNGYNSEGIDVSSRAIKYAKETMNQRCIKGNFSKYKFKKNCYDVVTIIDTIEHFSNPNNIINKINNILRKDGILVIQTPNYDSLISKLTKDKWFWLLIPQHIYLFSPKSICYILSKNNFRILNMSTWDDWNEFINNILQINRINNIGKYKIIYKILTKILKLFYPMSVLWNKLYLGGEILVYAQKKY